MFTQIEVEKMKVTKLEDVASIRYTLEKPTEAALQNEYYYLMAARLTIKLLEKGLISRGEYDKIMDKNRKTFQPFLAEIMV